MKITHIDHACFIIETKGLTIVTDPYSTDINGAIRRNKTLFAPDYVLITHGHGDHLGCLADIAGADTKVVTVVELASLLSKQRYDPIGMNLGGEINSGGVCVAMVKAEHTGGYEFKGQSYYAGIACGFVISDGEHTVYFAGDTDIFGDMALISKYYSPDIAILPVGGHYTMDVKKAIFACNELIKPQILIPMHYNTFPAIRVDLSPLNTRLTDTKTVVLDNGEGETFN